MILIQWIEFNHKYLIQKIVPIQGDLFLEKLGMTFEDRNIVTNEVDVIINSAASVNFDDPLQEAL